MIAEPGQLESLETSTKMKSLSSAELIKSFDAKFNQQTAVLWTAQEVISHRWMQKADVSQVKSGKPAKMRLRDAREVLEIARLKVLVSELREKAFKMEAKLSETATHHVKPGTRSGNPDEKKTDLQDAKHGSDKDLCTDADKISRQENHICQTSSGQGARMLLNDVNTVFHLDDELENVAKTVQDNMCHNGNRQKWKTNNDKDLLAKEDVELDREMAELRARIKNLQCDVEEMQLEIPVKLVLQKELGVAKERLKSLQEEMKDDAGITKVQLLLLKEQFGELEKIQAVNEHKELECSKVAQCLSMLEAEAAELRNGNKELWKHKQELSQKLLKALKKAEKITPVTKEDVLATQAEVSELKSTNMELQKKVESLQLSRFNEVEELVYLRWVNACLRHDLDTYKASRRNSEESSEESMKSASSSLEKDEGDLTSHVNSGRSFTSYSHVQEDLQSQNDDDESIVSCASTTTSSPQVAIQKHSSHSSPIPIKLGDPSSRHGSLLFNTDNYVNNTQASPQSITPGHANSSHTSPQLPTKHMVKTKSGPLLAAQQLSPSNSYLSQSPEHYCPPRYSPGKIALERDTKKLVQIQSRLPLEDCSPNSTTASSRTSSASNSRRRSGMSFLRSPSSSFPSFSEASTSHLQNSPPKQDAKRFVRSSSTLSSQSNNSISSRSMHAAPDRRHSASSGMSLLDEYLHSTDRRGPSRPTSRFSDVLPYERNSSDSASLLFPNLNEGSDPATMKERKYMKAHSFESSLDASDRVVAAFQALAASSNKNTHRTFKDLSRQNSYENKPADKVHDQVTDKYQTVSRAPVVSNEDAMSTGSKQSQANTRSSQAEFFCDLARAIQATRYRSIEKVAAFVLWFDRQGDKEKQEFFNFPECPRSKVEAMRRAVYEYEELQALESELNTYWDDLPSPTDLALKGMNTLLEKVENHIQGFRQARELAIAQFTELAIPTNWMLDSEMIAKIKQASLKLARTCIDRILNVLQDRQNMFKRTSHDGMLLQAAKFLLRIHNFAGGFDDHTASAFRMLQSQEGGLQ